MSAYDPDNIFGKILRGELPSHQIYEDDDTLAVMDVMPQSRGHVLVLPKHGSRNLLDADPQVLSKLIVRVQHLAAGIKKALGADGIRIAQFNEAPAGQTVFHLHFHIIPRFHGVPLQPHTGKMEDNEVLAANAEKITAALSA